MTRPRIHRDSRKSLEVSVSQLAQTLSSGPFLLRNFVFLFTIFEESNQFYREVKAGIWFNAIKIGFSDTQESVYLHWVPEAPIVRQ